MTLSLRTLSVLTALAAGFALAAALVAQHWVGLVPCPLCLLERWPWRVSIALSLLAFIAPARAVKPLLALAGLTIFADAALAFVHVGVERHFWPSPLPQCQAPVLTGSIADRLRALPAEPSMSCEDPVYLIPAIPLSMATMNMLYSLVVAVGLAIFLLDRRRTV
ncbi:MAG TPA: disulfide bond formation protein B [Acidisphaera sp.]|nr:disulfide bond formation protein B [Acidisphaera sp.]